MSRPRYQDYSGFSLSELFRAEAENQTTILTGALLELERAPARPHLLDTLMRAAHSLKGAARIVDLKPVVELAHVMEDCFVAAQAGRIQLGRQEIDVLLTGVDMLVQISRSSEGGTSGWGKEHVPEISGLRQRLESLLAASRAGVEAPPAPGSVPGTGASDTALAVVGSPMQSVQEFPERPLRLTAENLNRLLGLAGESLVESRWLRPFSDSMQRLKRLQDELSQSIDNLRTALESQSTMDQANDSARECARRLAECRQFLGARLQDLDLFDRRTANLSHRLYLEVLRARMRPFGDATRRFQRMVRDLARALGKEARLEIVGESTQVDRDLLERLDTPLVHLLRNAVDHGCELPALREERGKPREGLIRIEARHSAGMLLVTVSDDGPGINLGKLRETVLERRLATRAAVDELSGTELLEFLLLPGISLKDAVTELSGRGVGLDVVQNTVRAVRGSVRITTEPGAGARFQLQLPLTLSVMRALLVEVAGEPYALPLSRIHRTLKLRRDQVQAVEGLSYFSLGSQQVALTPVRQLLDCPDARGPEVDYSVVVLGERNVRHGLVVDRFLGERELVVQPLDPRLGKVQDIYAAALMEDGSPVLIMDVDDLLRSINSGLDFGK